MQRPRRGDETFGTVMFMARYRNRVEGQRSAAKAPEHPAGILVGEQPEDEMEGPVGRDVAVEIFCHGPSRRRIVGAVEP